MTEEQPTTASAAVEAEVDELPWAGLGEPAHGGVLSKLEHGRLRARILGEAYEPPKVGRFSILRKLGEGGMGAVYAAYDDELDRKVALKFLLPAQADDEHAIHRLLREAQALAKLSHPNLVPVFDVGRFEDQVYLAMELVPGQTIGAWAEGGSRPWREVLARWIEVARALVLVHSTGMVHRDIKPANVLVGEDGRARLVDFGLARGEDAKLLAGDDALEATLRAHDDVRESTAGGSRRSSKLAERVTQTRAVVGTPAYMAPELRHGELASRASDQYSLCVSLYESLFGTRPPGPTEDGALVRVAERARIPPALRRVLSRGLAMEATERYPSMQALLDALERVLGRRRRTLLTSGAALAFAAGLGGVLARTDVAPTVAPCDAMADDLDEVWGDASRAAVAAAIDATALPYAKTLAEQLELRIDDHAHAWLEARQRICEATRVHQVQSEALLDRRMACLDRQRDRFGALITAATEVDETRAPGLPRSFAVLDAPEDCELRALAESRAEPPPPEQRDTVARMRRAMDELRVGAVLEGPRRHLDQAQRLLDEAEALGYTPVLAEAELMLGHLRYLADDPGAREHLERAEALAEAVGDDLLKEDALRLSTRLSADLGNDPAELPRVWARNQATLRRLGEPPVRVARSKQTVAMLELRSGDRRAAEATFREEIALWQAQGGIFAGMEATAWRGLGDVLTGRGRLDDAHEAFEQAARIDARWGGATLDQGIGATRLGRTEHVRGVLALHRGRLDEASTLLTTALDTTTEAYGAGSVPSGRVHMELANLTMRQGRVDEAVGHARAADAAFRRWLGADHMMRAWPLSALGDAAFLREQGELAVEAFGEALRLQQAVLPADHLELATARSNLGEALVLAGRHEEAIEMLDAALAVMQVELDADHVRLSYPRQGLGEAYLALAQPVKALDHAERALALRQQHRSNPVELARTRWLLARCLVALGRHSEALVPARAAREAFAGMDQSFADEVDAIDALLGAAR